MKEKATDFIKQDKTQLTTRFCGRKIQKLCSMQRERTSTVTAEQINDLDELMDALDLLDEVGLDAEGVDDVEEAQRRLRQHLLAQQETSADMVSEMLLLAIFLYYCPD